MRCPGDQIADGPGMCATAVEVRESLAQGPVECMVRAARHAGQCRGVDGGLVWGVSSEQRVRGREPRTPERVLARGVAGRQLQRGRGGHASSGSA